MKSHHSNPCDSYVKKGFFSFTILALLLLLGGSLFALDNKHLEMNYGPLISSSIDAPYPEGNVTKKGLVIRLDNKIFPATGTPVGKGRAIRASRKLTNPDLPPLYKYQRERSVGYLITVPKGEYAITLHFAEIKRKASGERVFDIKLQDQVMETDFDVLARAGFEIPLDLVYKNIACPDGHIKLDFVQKSTRSTPAIAGISIVGKDFTKKINCGGKKFDDFEADWSTKEYLEDPYTSGMLFDTELLRYSAAWSYGLMKFRGTVYDGSHGSYPEISGDQAFGTSVIPGWIPANQKLAFDPRDQASGPLPQAWARFKGFYAFGQQTLLTYDLNGSAVFDLPSTEKISDLSQTFVRDMQVTALKQPYRQVLLESILPAQIKGSIATITADDQTLLVGIKASSTVKLSSVKLDSGRYALLVSLPAHTALNYKIMFSLSSEHEPFKTQLEKSILKQASDFEKMTLGGEKRWDQSISTQGLINKDSTQTFAVDEITLPVENPWQSWMRPAAFDFFDDGKSLALSTWSGDIWIAKNLNEKLDNIIWTRYATGLFHPLGIKVIDGLVYVQGRDQITRLHDINKDGEADFYECFNNDVKISTNFHEFSFELHQDPQKNLYFVKGAPVKAGGEGFDTLTKHHGSLMRVSPDGKKLDVIATGFRAPNGMGMSSSGQITVSDNEGNWVPATPINWISEGGFYGVIPTAQAKISPKKRDQVICYIPHSVDNSAGGQAWIPKGSWGPYGGELIHLSYGKAKVFHVLKEEVNGKIQGGVVAFDPAGGFDAGIMRARFNKHDQALYVCGLKGWQTNGVKDGGLYRMRYTQKALCRPIALAAGKNGLRLTFSQALDEVSALDSGNYAIEQWVYQVSEKYGSKHYRVPNKKPWNFESSWLPLDEDLLTQFNQQEFTSEDKRKAALETLLEQAQGQDQVKIKSISISDDKKSVFLEIPAIAPVMQMKIAFKLNDSQGQEVKHEIYNTIHQLGTWSGTPGKAQKTQQLLDEQAGILVKFKHLGQKTTDLRIQRLLALYVKEKSDITPFLDHGPFEAHFDGYIKVDQNKSVEFKLVGKGEVKLSINGITLADYLPIDPNKSYPATLNKGLNKVLLQYKSPSEGDSQLRLLWKSDDWPLEPIPPSSLVYEAAKNTALKTAQQLRTGRQIFAENNCIQCHSSTTINSLKMTRLKLAPPQFESSISHLKADWMRLWISNPHKLKPSSTMPHLLSQLSESEATQTAADIAAYLSPKPSPTVTSAPSYQTSSDHGQELFADLGCASCHDFKQEVEANQISLFYVDQKFAPNSLRDYLIEPGKYKPAGTMPDFNLSSEEATSLASYLRSQASHKVIPQIQGDAAKGKLAYEKFACSKCHNNAADHSGTTLFSTELDFEKAHPNQQFALSTSETQALHNFLASDGRSLNRHSSIEFAQDQVQQLNCLHCHGRDDSPSQWKSPHLDPKDLPPHISFIGEKLKPSHLKDIFKGESTKMRPWMKARMPAFKSRADALAEGLAHEHGFSDLEPQTEIPESKFGLKLLGMNGGFSCIVCHDVGSTKAIAPFGAPGVDLKYSAQRLRYNYYLRWMLNPQRLVKSTPMTRFSNDNKTTFLKDIHSGDAKKQFDDIWNYLQGLTEK
ncbi:c-type cytochrome [Lentisphaera profundi]|uniref:C-type cytochrome n=1 Tax=Lentisphaera profundi TaxID=1658616 RepID=A0ABY7VWI4_9BACT|nr:DUF6797 domain-containing protein [Lentisphaera profundi]WDE98601.1 c-type cytochrome [Lentisphaera profundi]